MRQLTRRSFNSLPAGLVAGAARAAAERPNILWLTCEDMGPHTGAYGDRFANTPNLDRLAARGLAYEHCWSSYPVCAPARTTIISGMYPASTGSEHMRSMTRLPAAMKMYPCYLRDAGYYASNNVKEDYNLEHTGTVWDDSSNRAHWRNRKVGQPFFSIFNFTITHESQIRRRPHKLVGDPSRVPLPAYHPDTPEVRHDWTQYYDNITTMDGQAADVLKQLESDGLAESTIVFFYGDHGSGMPRSKRWPYNSGLRVPLIVHFPEKFGHLAPKEYRPGRKSDRLVSFVDLAPTVLSIAGIKPPSHFQGHAFLGPHTAPEQPYLYGFRGRMDERYDLVRSVRDRRYIYVRNYMPHKIYGQHLAYMFETPTTTEWKRLFDEGKLEPPKTAFWERKPPEELYDLENDRDEVNNLAGSPEHRRTLERLSKAQQDLALKIRDVGFLPEGEIHARSEGSTPFEMGHSEGRYPMKRVFAAAGAASLLRPDTSVHMIRALGDKDSAVRYWGALGILMRGSDAVKAAKKPLDQALNDSSPYVRVVAAQALAQYGEAADLERALAVLVELAPADKNGVYVSLAALNALDELDEKAASVADVIKKLPEEDPNAPQRMRSYVPRLIEKTLADIEAHRRS